MPSLFSISKQLQHLGGTVDLYLRYLQAETARNVSWNPRYRQRKCSASRARTFWMLVTPEESFFTRKTGGS